jgi:hypothetical protein
MLAVLTAEFSTGKVVDYTNIAIKDLTMSKLALRLGDERLFKIDFHSQLIRGRSFSLLFNVVI